MATILIKRGSQANVKNLALEYGEIALAYNADKSAVDIYAGTGNGVILINQSLSDEVKAAIEKSFTDAKGYTNEKIDALVNGAPEAMDTLAELAEALSENKDVVDAINSAIGNKVDKEDGKGLSSEDYTTEEKTKLEGIEAGAQVNPSVLYSDNGSFINGDSVASVNVTRDDDGNVTEISVIEASLNLSGVAFSGDYIDLSGTEDVLTKDSKIDGGTF